MNYLNKKDSLFKNLFLTIFIAFYLPYVSAWDHYSTIKKDNIKNANNRNYAENREKIVYDEKAYFSNTINARSLYSNDACHLNIECNKHDATHLRLPIHGPKGDQGPPGIMGPKGEKGEPGIAGIPAREPPIPNFSAFFASLTKNIGPFKQDHDLIFTHVTTNFGNHYDPNTGVYTVPFKGFYQFFATISATGRQKAGVNIMKNGASILIVWSESEPWSTTTQPIILQCNQGDRIYLRIQARASHLHGYLYSSFGGSLLYEEISSY